MILSRTSRILLGFLLLALAGFIWLNLVVANDSSFSPFLQAAPAPDAGAPAEELLPEEPSLSDGETRVARELEVLELPFLVTEPPPDEESEDPAEEIAEELPQPPERATLNPFAPIIRPIAPDTASAPLEADSTAVEERTASTTQPTVTEVPLPVAPSNATSGPQTVQPPPKAPAPTAVAPRSSPPAALPRALPDGALGGTPELLRSAISPVTPPVEEVQEAVAIPAPQVRALLAEEPRSTSRDPEPSPEPLERPLLESAESVSEAPAMATRPVPQPPLQAGTSVLSRYLRDNDVRFTGSVIGPVSVGVFRASFTSAPIVISLGQTLPDTSIVLTDLRGQQAEFTHDDNKQILTLELRR